MSALLVRHCGIVGVSLLLGLTLHHALSAGPVAAGTTAPHQGVSLLGDFRCDACHAAPSTARRWLQSPAAPNLEEVAARASPEFLRAYLRDPTGVVPGGRMPDLLASLPPAQRAPVAEDLVHYLVSQSEARLAAESEEYDPLAAEAGGKLYHQIGCVACHPPEGHAAEGPGLRPLDHLSRKTTPSALAAMLLDPLAVYPSGQMPSFRLDAEEARRLAQYLLREQAEDEMQDFPGLRFEYFEESFQDNPATFDGFTPVARGQSKDFSLSPRRREDHYGFRFAGLVQIDTPGEYTFFTNSDDGSRLSIRGAVVVDNGGNHAMQEKSGTVTLEAGLHALEVTFYECDGDDDLEVSYAGPGIEKQAIPSRRLFHRARRMVAPPAGLVVDPSRAASGREWFQKLGCVHCHAPETAATQPPGRPLDALDPEAAHGCLGEPAAEGVPRFGFTAEERAELRRALQRTPTLRRPPPDSWSLDRHLEVLQCLACHERDGQGGPAAELRPFFGNTVTVDMGDEGRLPPPLTGVGQKLREPWMHTVLQRGGAVRPYMATRMPQFGAANVEALPALFLAVDDPGEPPDDEPAFDTERIEAGRRLVGSRGFSCITCHVLAGRPSLGIPAMDLASSHERLQIDWFRRYLLDPQQVRPGTRMPSFWDASGTSAFAEILDGDARAQVDALWTYLSLGQAMPLPLGLEVSADFYDVEVIDEPRMVGVFMKDVGPRTVAVGLPERTHYAFDSDQLRVARVWRGPFFHARGTWEGRAGALEVPPGEDVLELPPGPPFATPADADPEWPVDARAVGYRKRGVRFDEQHRPAFRYQYRDIEIDEELRAHIEVGGSWLTRRFRLRAPASTPELLFRVALGATLDPLGNGEWQLENGLRLRSPIPPRIRLTAAGAEVVLPVPFEPSTGGASAALLEVSISW